MRRITEKKRAQCAAGLVKKGCPPKKRPRVMRKK